MDILIAVLVAIAVYYFTYKVLFEDRNEWIAYMKHEIKWLPISLIFDNDIDSSIRLWFWLISGICIGAATYFELSHY